MKDGSGTEGHQGGKVMGAWQGAQLGKKGPCPQDTLSSPSRLVLCFGTNPDLSYY